MNNALEIKNLTITHRGGVIAASDFSCEVALLDAKILAGPIGSGKSSILRAVAGLLKYEGDIIWKGKNLSNISVKDRNFVYASHDSPLFLSKTLEYNLGYGARLRKEDETKILMRIKKVAEIFSLTEFLSTKLRLLPYKAKQLCIIARAFIRDAELYLLNDVLRAFDDLEFPPIVERINTLFRERKATMLISTSDYALTAPLDCKTIIISGGKKIHEGDSDYFKANNLDKFTELFTSL